jgi:hypothetical protein
MFTGVSPEQSIKAVETEGASHYCFSRLAKISSGDQLNYDDKSM